jgi:indolepyruvate ferredoxin oxidoreductase
MNLGAFRWGRRTAADRNAVEALAAPPVVDNVVPFARLSKTVDEIVASRVKHLTGYQNAALAERYRAMVERVRAVEQQAVPGETRLAEVVARNYAKLLAYKDEYEVARLFTEAAFAAQLNSQFEGDFRLKFHLAPPLFAARDPKTGHLLKQEFGPWMLSAFRLLAKLKGLRGSAFDPFGYTAERREERALIREYEGLVDELLGGISVANHALAVNLAAIPDDIRGYGHVKDSHLVKARHKWDDLLVQWRNSASLRQAAE